MSIYKCAEKVLEKKIVAVHICVCLRLFAVSRRGAKSFTGSLINSLP